MKAGNGKKSIVVIGGGTGTHTVLRGLKQYRKSLNLTAVVSMADSGGSTGRLRDEFGQLPVGDVRMALAALASDNDEHDELLRQLFLHRFDKGNGLSGHNFGNLLLVALTDILGSEESAIHAASRVLRVSGQVVPVTNENVHLVAQYEDGVMVTGEHAIDEPKADRFTKRITKLSVTPRASINARAKDAILKADLIVLGPGDLYTSVLANVVVDGVAEAIKESSGRVVYVCNLMTKAGQTLNMTAQDHVEEIKKYIGVLPDFVVTNVGEFPSKLLLKYEEDQEFPVVANCTNGICTVITDDLLAKEEVVTKSGDTLKRSLIRHDSHKLARKLIDLL
ncbi:YvcK family protein [Candidatus Kaiserbacteria bacterium]|nr:YvcK family protein [Candidatus Kaiserbacteria bacterium]